MNSRDQVSVDSPSERPDAAGFTLAVRVRLAGALGLAGAFAGAVDADGRDRILLQVRLAGADPLFAEFDRRQNYLRFADSRGQRAVLDCVFRADPPVERLRMLRAYHDQACAAFPALAAFQPEADMAAGILRIGVPIDTLGPSAEVEIVVRATPAHVELFVDGVVVDEDWPGRPPRRRTAP